MEQYKLLIIRTEHQSEILELSLAVASKNVTGIPAHESLVIHINYPKLQEGKQSSSILAV
jgi:hypothetical protein